MSVSDPGTQSQWVCVSIFVCIQVRPSGSGCCWRCSGCQCSMPGQRAGGSAARCALRLCALRQRGAGAMDSFALVCQPRGAQSNSKQL